MVTNGKIYIQWFKRKKLSKTKYNEKYSKIGIEYFIMLGNKTMYRDQMVDGSVKMKIKQSDDTVRLHSRRADHPTIVGVFGGP